MLDTIERATSTLSRAEQRVAEWILAHPRQTIEGSVRDVAAAAGTSEPSVIRFCRSVGLSGFRELKIRLTESLTQPHTYLHRHVTPDDSIGDAVSKVMDSSIQALIEVRRQVHALPLEEAVTMMANARQLIFVGLGASASVACDARHKFFRLGLPCATAVDAPTIVQSAAIADPRDVFVVVSHSGNWPDLQHAIALAMQRRAQVIAITSVGSPLAQSDALVLACPAAEDTSHFTPMSSRLAHLALLDALQVALTLRLGQSGLATLKTSKDALGHFRLDGPRVIERGSETH